MIVTEFCWKKKKMSIFFSFSIMKRQRYVHILLPPFNSNHVIQNFSLGIIFYFPTKMLIFEISELGMPLSLYFRIWWPWASLINFTQNLKGWSDLTLGKLISLHWFGLLLHYLISIISKVLRKTLHPVQLSIICIAFCILVLNTASPMNLRFFFEGPTMYIYQCINDCTRKLRFERYYVEIKMDCDLLQCELVCR